MSWKQTAKHIYLDDDPLLRDSAVARNRSRLKRTFAVVLATVMAVLTVLPAVGARPAFAAPNPRKVHPQLTQLAASAPDQTVDVLVSLTDANVQWSTMSKSVGNGRLIKRWKVSPTMEIQLPAKFVAYLSSVPGVRWVTPNAKVVATALPDSLQTVYPVEAQAPAVWDNHLQGDGVTVAVLDTGIAAHPDLKNVLKFGIDKFADGVDRMGHGTAVAGVIAGQNATGSYVGIAPHARILSLKVLGDDGTSTLADVLTGLEWVNNNRQQYNIRVVNLSLSAGTPDSYVKNPINAAVEALWQNGVVVVAASGNHGTEAGAASVAPGNDPFAITVGAVDDHGTADPANDSIADFSSRGTTLDGYSKPDVVAPGVHIVAPLAAGSYMATTYPDRTVDDYYLSASGTSLSAPVVAGAAALIVQARPDLRPDQIKWLLTNTAVSYSGQPDQAGIVDVADALNQAASLSPVPSANQGVTPATGIKSDATGASVDQIYWDEIYWDEIYWDEIYWDEMY